MKIRRSVLIIILLFISIYVFSDTILDLYKTRNFTELIKYEKKAKELSKQDLYYVGFAFFQLENDSKAIEMYDLAIDKGLNEDYVYLYKGLSYLYSNNTKKAIENYNIAIELNPKGQKNHCELGNVYFYSGDYETALIHFRKARDLQYELGDPYIKIPYIFHIQNNFDVALKEYYISKVLIDKESPAYKDILEGIGILEYSRFKNYSNSIKAYSELIAIQPDSYSIYQELIKSYYAENQYSKGDSLFSFLKNKYDNNELSEDFMEFKSVKIDEFYINDQRVSVQKYFDEPLEFADQMYKFFLIDKAGESVERTIHTEKTEGEMLGIKHVLCEYDKIKGVHYTYQFGWKSNKINYDELKEAVIKVLDGKVDPQASFKY